MELSIPEASSTSSLETSTGSPSAISSSASAVGPSPCGLPDGPTIDLFGPAPAPASPSAPLGSRRVRKTSATSGQPSPASSASVALTSSLASRLRERLGTVGSTLYRQTWKQKATPSGIAYWAHTASARPTSGSDSTGWPTPNATIQNDGDSTWEQRRAAMAAKHGNNGFGMTLGQAVMLSGWPSPVVNDAKGSDYSYSQGNHDRPALKLGGAAKTAAWPTPIAADGRGSAGAGKLELPNVATLAGWSTASARDWKDSAGMAVTATNPDGSSRTRLDQLPRQAALAGWPAPTAALADKGVRSQEGAIREAMRSKGPDLAAVSALLGPARLTADGRLLTGSGAATAPGGRLNPAHSRWLMGFPPAWDDCAVTAMPSSRKSRRNS